MRCSERGLQPRICDGVIRVDDIPVLPGWKGRLSLILLLAKGLYQMISQEKKGPGPSGLGDVGDEVFADVDIAYKGATVIKPFRLGKEQFGGDRVRIDLGQNSIYFRIYHTFLVISERLGKLSYRQLASH